MMSTTNGIEKTVVERIILTHEQRKNNENSNNSLAKTTDNLILLVIKCSLRIHPNKQRSQG